MALASRKLKRRLLSTLPMLERPGRAATRQLRRWLRIPHQASYRVVRELPENGLYLDIGANHGQSIDSIRLFCPRARIVSFEAQPHLAEELRRRYPDVQVYGGLGARPETIKLYVPTIHGHRIDPLASADKARAARELARYDSRGDGVLTEITCEIRTLDSFAFDPVFIKIDVEGFERNVVLGGLETIKRHRPLLLIEGGGKLLDILGPLGYRHEPELDVLRPH